MAKKPLGTDSMGIQKTMRIGDYLATAGGQVCAERHDRSGIGRAVLLH